MELVIKGKAREIEKEFPVKKIGANRFELEYEYDELCEDVAFQISIRFGVEAFCR
ncbi:MAG: hypothetical protein ACO2PM_16745 [Pyrobaculum sp.]|jgi:hypothetical protein